MKTGLRASVLLFLILMAPLVAQDSRRPLVQIGKAHMCLLGHYEYISISVRAGSAEISAFDLTVAFQPDALELVEVLSKTASVAPEVPNPARLEDSVNTGFVRIVGEFRPERYDSSATIELAVLKFLISNSREFDCAALPLRFAWIHCGDNRLTLSDGSQIAAGRVFDHGWKDVLPSNYGEITGNDCSVEWFAHFCGVCDLCSNQPEKPALVEGDFWNGLIDLVCTDMELERAGDINQNGIDNEISDVRLLADGLLYGIDSLHLFETWLNKVTDVNHDCVPASVGDVIYMVRIVTGDALPFSKLAPKRPEFCPVGKPPYPWHAWIHKNADNPPPPAHVYNSVLVDTRDRTLELSSDEDLAGIFAIFELAEPQQLDSLTGPIPMQLEQTIVGNQLRVLIWSGTDEIWRKLPGGKHSLFVLPSGAALKFLQAADYNGNLLDVIEVTGSGQVKVPLVYEQ